MSAPAVHIVAVSQPVCTPDNWQLALTHWRLALSWLFAMGRHAGLFEVSVHAGSAALWRRIRISRNPEATRLFCFMVRL